MVSAYPITLKIKFEFTIAAIGGKSIKILGGKETLKKNLVGGKKK